MNLLSRKDQQYVAIQYEREYGKLIIKKNKEEKPDIIIPEAKKLFQEIKKVTTIQNHFFDEDIIDFLQTLLASIEQNFFHTHHNDNKKTNNYNIIAPPLQLPGRHYCHKPEKKR